MVGAFAFAALRYCAIARLAAPEADPVMIKTDIEPSQKGPLRAIAAEASALERLTQQQTLCGR
jgi:hypothetical protein